MLTPVDRKNYKQHIMNIEELREYCLSIKGASECLPFDEDTLVYKVMDKMFVYYSLTPKDGDFFVSMKCNPEKSTSLREQYNGIIRGYHMDKKHWISVYLNSDVPDKLIKELILHSVDEVIGKLPQKKQDQYRMNKTEVVPYPVRKATRKDTDELEKLYDDLNDYMASTVNYPGWLKGIYPIRETAAEGIAQGSLFVAEDNGRIIGSIILNHIPEKAYDQVKWLIDADDYNQIFVVRTLVVHPAYLRKQVGSTLMHFAVYHAMRSHIKSIRLDVSTGNTPAIDLYRKLGYQFIGTVDLGLPYEHLKWFELYEKVL